MHLSTLQARRHLVLIVDSDQKQQKSESLASIRSLSLSKSTETQAAYLSENCYPRWSNFDESHLKLQRMFLWFYLPAFSCTQSRPNSAEIQSLAIWDWQVSLFVRTIRSPILLCNSAFTLTRHICKSQPKNVSQPSSWYRSIALVLIDMTKQKR